ncbi:hemerythrin domain-containing protein [Neisseria sp. ZJ106]|uniref:Hemerythrin domain-containing protein n=1 Tax=Neisseria lisongii TaxID=2912188 RepID=A0ABY7RKG7_9NEIS|nr:hemerythrin domain-containing protein [Neisseria lisongii]MCF7520468.1 hemerythrin domain-containing protein [Neisseria lisongii]WCL71590.1 hemerythrin domain-containing protein [Neisseria lisongii]
MQPLKRHPKLIQISREHHHSLALCVRILRMPSENHRHEIEPHIIELKEHFKEEEQQFAPHWQHIAPELRQRFEHDHAKLRAAMAAPDYDSEAWNTDFAQTLRDHARFEERELFPAIEPYLD